MQNNQYLILFFPMSEFQHPAKMACPPCLTLLCIHYGDLLRSPHVLRRLLVFGWVGIGEIERRNGRMVIRTDQHRRSNIPTLHGAAASA